MKILLLIDTTLGGIAFGLVRLPDAPPIPASSMDFLGYEFKENGSVISIAEALDQLLRTRDLAIKDIHTIGVSVGPGSFTGIKIGIAFAEGLVTGSMQRIRLIGVSSLQSLGESFAKGIGNAWFLPVAAEQGFLTINMENLERLYACRVEEDQFALYDSDARRVQAAEFCFAAAKRVDIIGACPKIENRLTKEGMEVVWHNARDVASIAMSTMAQAVYQRWLENAFVESLTPLYLRKSTPEEKLRGIKGEQ